MEVSYEAKECRSGENTWYMFDEFAPFGSGSIALFEHERGEKYEYKKEL